MVTTAYFDNSATTKPCAQAVEAAENAIINCWGNPSSLHRTGNEANAIIEQSRGIIADRLRCSPGEIYFTSGGTESDNLAVLGAAEKMKRHGKKIVSTEVEHPAVYDSLSALESKGFEIVRIAPRADGSISESDIYEAVTPDTILISIMAVNNETGAVLPYECAKKAALRAGSPALVHVDAVQAFGKLPLKPSSSGVDLMSISSHKIHGIKGAGALYVNKKIKIAARVYGGEQESKLRPGTEAVPAIAAFAAATQALGDINTEKAKIEELKKYMLLRFADIGGIEINSPENASPYVTNVSVIGVKSEPMLNFLSANGVCVSSGSACSKGKKSRVLRAMNLGADRLDSAIRISFSRYSSQEEIDLLCEMIARAKQEIYSK